MSFINVTKTPDHLFALKVNLNVKQGGKRLEHQGIRIEFVGQIGEHDLGGVLLSLSNEVFMCGSIWLHSKPK